MMAANTGALLAEFETQARSRLERMRRGGEAMGVVPEISVRTGDVERMNPDLVAVITHRDNWIERLLSGTHPAEAIQSGGQPIVALPASVN
jgi:hypothetical protein